MKIYCPAKINLFLNVLGVDNDTHMHILSLINQTIDLYDEIEMILIDDGIVIESNDNIPLDEKNSIYKAAKLLKATYDISNGMKFIVKKKIPLEAGLGGESTDAAGTMLLINNMLNLNISIDKLLELGSKIGSDVPFFIKSGFKLIRGTGNIVLDASYENPFSNYIIVKPTFGLSTKEMFKKIDECDVKNVDDRNIPYNDFMKVVPKDILEIRDYFNSINLTKHTLSGSGSSYYVALDKENKKLYKEIKSHYSGYEVYMVSNCDGYKVIE